MRQMPVFILLTACISALLYFHCHKQSGSSSASKPQRPATPLPFTPPADSVITSPQLHAWFRCNGKLDSLTFRFSGLLAVTDPALLVRYQNAFSVSQDSICVESGLQGGYGEYLWIMDNLGGTRNIIRFDSMKAAYPADSSRLSTE